MEEFSLFVTQATAKLSRMSSMCSAAQCRCVVGFEERKNITSIASVESFQMNVEPEPETEFPRPSSSYIIFSAVL